MGAAHHDHVADSQKDQEQSCMATNNNIHFLYLASRARSIVTFRNA